MKESSVLPHDWAGGIFKIWMPAESYFLIILCKEKNKLHRRLHEEFLACQFSFVMS